MSAIVSGAAAAVLAAGLAAGLAYESEQIRPYSRVQHHGPPGPALIEKLEASSAGGANIAAAHGAVESVQDSVTDITGATVSDVCHGDVSASVMLDAVLCVLGGNVESLLEPLLAGTSPE